VTVDPGTIIEIETWDCFTGQVQSEEDTLEKLDLARVNSATGPNWRARCRTGGHLVGDAARHPAQRTRGRDVYPRMGQLIETVHSPTTRIFKVADGTVTMNDRVSFPARPMFGSSASHRSPATCRRSSLIDTVATWTTT